MKKIILILTLLVLALFSVSSIYAADVNDTLAADEYTAEIDLSQGEEINEIIEIDDSQAIGQQNDEEVLGEANIGTFTELSNNISNNYRSTLKLDKDYECEDGFSTYGIKIEDSITIDGQGHTIDAKGKGSVFSVAADNVTIKNLTIKNAYVKDEYGGAIYLGNSENHTVSQCTFINNHAKYGGAICGEGYDNKVISECTFINNSAKKGGAIYWDSQGGNASHCVFLNNSADEGSAIYIFSGSYLTVDYCWFGNTATDYDGDLPISGGSCSNRMFLNATANPDAIALSDTSDIIFKLCLYNSTSGNITEYDNAPFKNLNLTITATNGLANDTAKLGEIIKYNATTRGTGSITAAIENVAYTIELDIKFDPKLSFESQSSDFSDNTIIALNYNASATGTVNITLKGKNGNNYTFTNLALNATILLAQEISADEYDVTVTYSGDNDFVNATSTGKLTINKVNSTLTVKDITFNYGDEGSCEVSYTGATGIETKLDGHDEAVKVAGNIITVSNLDAGNYTLTVTAIADSNHNNVTKTVNIAVNKVDSTISVNDVTLDYGTSTNVAVTTEGATGITAKINDKEAVVENNTIVIPVLDAGTYTLTVTAIADSNHNNVTKNVTIVVNKLKTQLTANAVTTTYNVNKNLVITLKDANGKALSGVKVTVNINGDKTYDTDNNGQIIINVAKFVPKTYNAKISFAGDDKYQASSAEVKVTVKKAKSKITAKKKTFKKSKKVKKYTITLKSGKTAIKKVKVSIKIGKKTYNAKTNAKGKATFKIKKLTKKGSYKAVVKFKGNKYYKKATKKVKITIK